jgi:hypothetical protein
MRSVIAERFGAHNRPLGSQLAGLYGRALLRPSQLPRTSLAPARGAVHARAASHHGRALLPQRRRLRAALVALQSVAVTTTAGYGTVTRLTGPPGPCRAFVA